MVFNIKKVVMYSIIIILSLFLGWSYGAFTTIRDIASKEVSQDTGKQITLYVNALIYLRNGSTQKAIDLIEQDLDTQIMNCYRDIRGTDEERYALEAAIKRAKMYRLQYPRTTDSHQIDQIVNEVLSRVNKTAVE